MHSTSCHFTLSLVLKQVSAKDTYWLAEHNFTGHSIITDNGPKTASNTQVHTLVSLRCERNAEISFKLLFDTVHGAEVRVGSGHHADWK